MVELLADEGDEIEAGQVLAQLDTTLLDAQIVVAIAHEVEFTPRNVQTQEERVNLVFAVKVCIPNPDGALKPGMLADATVRP